MIDKTIEQLKSIDRSSVYLEYNRWPELAEMGSKVEPRTEFKDVERVIVVGVGGSAAAGDIVGGWASTKESVDYLVFKGYIPKRDMRNTLVIACSFSGNTFETINMAYLSMKRNAKLLALSHGGILQRKSKEWGIEHIKMPKTVAPRYVLPFNVFAITKIVSSVYSINAEKEIKDSLEWMQKIRINISTESDIKNNTAIKLAESILKKVAKIYGDRITGGVATRFKNSINENAKRPACFETMPEAFHNDVASWENGSSIFIPVILRHKDEDKDEKKRIDKFTSLLKDVTNPLEVRGKGKKLLSELVTMTYLLDYASYYLAILSGTDPLPTKMIDVMRR